MLVSTNKWKTNMLFKIYNQDGTFLMAESIRELADLCGVSLKVARNAYYQKVSRFNDFDVINLSK